MANVKALNTAAASAGDSKKKNLEVHIDYDRDALLTSFGRKTLDDRYLLDEESSPQEAFARAAKAFGDDQAHAQRLYNYASKLWMMYATPILSNGGSKRGMPISCFLNHVPDSREGLAAHYTENIWLASLGGGIGGDWSKVRSDGQSTTNGSESSGVIPFLHVVDSQMLAFNQGRTRRGSYAAYMDISHPEIIEFINMRKPSGGDANRKCLNLHHGVNIPDAFMHLVEASMMDANANDDWALVDPNSGDVTQTVSARQLWERILETRHATGEPYVHFIDTTNDALPQSQKLKGLRVNQSNLCSEITLPTNEDRTAVCCLSSVNLARFDEWKDDPHFIPDMVRMLDNVLDYFIKNAPEDMWRAVNSATQERAIGLGAMGFHTYLQEHNMPFSSALASGQNRRMFAHIKQQAVAASEQLAVERGEAPDMVGTGRRNSHLMAIAPNASSSIICGGTSPAIEPIRANAYTQKTMSGSFLVKNPALERLLDKYGFNDEDTWSSIVADRGSVQGLDFLTDWEKDVFATAIEIDQHWVIDHAASRQPHVCQSQSLNIFVPHDASVAYLHSIHFQAWKRGLKSLYYTRSETAQRAESLNTRVPSAATAADLQSLDDSACLACEG